MDENHTNRKVCLGLSASELRLEQFCDCDVITLAKCEIAVKRERARQSTVAQIKKDLSHISFFPNIYPRLMDFYFFLE